MRRPTIRKCRPRIIEIRIPAAITTAEALARCWAADLWPDKTWHGLSARHQNDARILAAIELEAQQ